MDSRLSRWCDGLIEAGVLAAVIVTPLFFNIHSDRVFEPDKLTLLRSIALLVAFAWLIKFVDQKGWQHRSQLSWRNKNGIWRMPFVLPIMLLVLIYLLSTLFSVTPSVSWAGSYQRLQGTYSTLSYIVIFGVTIGTMRTRAQARRLVTAVIITSIPISFYGLLQHYNLDPLPWGGDTQSRVAGHMGNAIFIAAYLIMAVPLTLSRIIVSFHNILNDSELATADVIRSSIYIFTLAIQLITIVWSGSRGPWLGIGVGVFAFVLIVLVALRNASSERSRFRIGEAGWALLLLIGGTAVPYFLAKLGIDSLTNSGRAPSLAGPMASFAAFAVAILVVVLAIFVMIAAQKGWRWLWFSWIGLALILGGWLLLFNLPPESTADYRQTPVVGDLFDTLESWRDLPRIGRLGRILEAEGGTGKVRTLIWEGALELIAPHEPLSFPNGGQDTFNILRPLIGYGPESMYVAYNRFYPPELATLEARNASPDRSHNETFDALVITGWSGFLVWQILYLSVFYYGFKWLGVLRTKFDRNLLIGLWVGMGVLTAVGFSLWRGPVYAGVALPFGSIGGLILYLIYYALFAKLPQSEQDGHQNEHPFAADRMLMVALLAGVLAHYVEIHFGIAIAATRLHFFLYVGVMFITGYLLPRFEKGTAAVPNVEKESVTKPAPSSKKRKRRPRQRAATSAVSRSWHGPVMLSALLMALIIGVLGFEFINFVQMPNVEYQSIADLPAGDVFHQSLFLDSSEGFRDSPFIYVMIILTWMLGALLLVSEMVKDGELIFATSQTKLPQNRRTILAGLFLIMGVAGLGARFIVPTPLDVGSTWLLGRSLLMGWGLFSTLAGLFLLLKSPASRMIAGAVAAIGVVGSLPVIFAGSWVGWLTAALSLGLLYWLWDKSWQNSLLPALSLAAGSLILGLLYTYTHAGLLRNSLFFRPTTQLETPAQLNAFRVLEASQAAGFLTTFYLFVFLVIVVAGFVLASTRGGRVKENGTQWGFGLLITAVILLPYLISTTNLGVIQADMIYKRGRFYDGQAGSERSAELWDTAIAIYENVIDRTPREDFYYLFLGRAYLERSTISEDPLERVSLLNQADTRLQTAQSINPLNTDHTANLARLNSRRVALSTDPDDQAARLATAEGYYQDALALSPQNSVIRNEYARLSFEVKQDCEQSIELFTQSVTIDPFYEDSYFGLGDIYARCAATAPEADQADYYESAIDYIEQGLELEPNNARFWARAAQIYEDFDLLPEAIEAYVTIGVLDPTGGLVPAWRIAFKQADLYLQLGDEAQAQSFAEQALLAAPAEVQPEIQLFLSQFVSNLSLSEGGSESVVELDGGQPLVERPLATIPIAERERFYTAYPPIIIDPTRQYEAIVTTEQGELRFQLFPEAAPLAVNNFVFLATQGFYDGLTFHRVLADFMAQAGDPTGTGGGSPGYQFINEVDGSLNFDRRGLLAMANAGPDTNGSQFFITFAPVPNLNGRYTIFGELLDGDDTLSAITLRDPEAAPDFSGDLILRIDIEESE